MADQHPKMDTSRKFQVHFLKIIGTLVTAIVLLKFIIVAAISLLFRSLAIVLARMTRPDLPEIVHDPGQLFASESVHTKASFTIVMHLVCDGTVSLDALRNQFRRQLLPSSLTKNGRDTYKRLRQSWTQYMGYLFWKWVPNFSVENHIRTYDYTEPELKILMGFAPRNI